jgi:tellurite resistance protein TerC
MILSHHHPIPTWVSLAVIGAILTVGILASIIAANRGVSPLLSPLADDLEELAVVTLKHARRVLTIVIGASVLLVGVAMLVLPGPAVIVIPAGLAILGGEVVWARRLIRKMKEQAGKLANTVGLGSDRDEDSNTEEREEER